MKILYYFIHFYKTLTYNIGIGETLCRPDGIRNIIMEGLMSKQKPIVPIMFEEKMKRHVEKVAKKEGRSFAGQIRYIVGKWIESPVANATAFIVMTTLMVAAAVILSGCGNPVSIVDHPVRPGLTLSCDSCLVGEK